MRNISPSSIGVIPTKMHNEMELFDLTGSRLLLDICRAQSVAVLGVEGFRVDKGFLIPEMNCIADFSELIHVHGEKKFSKASIDLMFTFLDILEQDGYQDLYLEFVLAYVE